MTEIKLPLVGGDPAPEVPDRLYGKFRVARVDGRDRPGGDKANAAYFVLDYTNDPFARRALVAYAAACAAEFPGLAADLRAKVPVESQSDPLVLSLPTVPDGAVALVAANGVRWLPTDDPGWYEREGMPDVNFRLGELLDSQSLVTVELAPPREPRTWPKLSKGPADVSIIRGTSGQTWYRDEIRHDLWRADNGAIVHGDIPGLQALDGPLTEVFDDEPGGELP